MALHRRYPRKLFALLLAVAPLSGFAQSPGPMADSNPEAEYRIVSNLAIGLPRYDGVRIVYSYKVHSEGNWSSADELTSTVSAAFSNVVSAVLESEGSDVLLKITTEGDQANHRVYTNLLTTYGSTLATHRRKYLLK